jgi:hypothetical protein
VAFCNTYYYRPPGSVAAFWENFEYSIEQAMNYTSNIIINGDLNVDLLRENNNKLLEIISEFTNFSHIRSLQ